MLKYVQLRGRLGLRVFVYGVVVVREGMQRSRSFRQVALKPSLSYVTGYVCVLWGFYPVA